MRLYLIRHTSVAVAPGTCYGSTDVDVSATFEAEAEKVRQALEGHHFSGVYSSTLSRAVRLARFCGYEPREDRRLSEMDFGQWEMMRYDEISDPQLERWYNDFMNERARGGESFQDQRKRVGESLDEIISSHGKDDEVAIFSHGGTIVAALLHLGIVTEENAFRDLLPYGGIRIVEI